MTGVHTPGMAFLEWLGRTTWQAGVLAGLVALVVAMGGRWLTSAWRHRLWLLVIGRLALPAVPGSDWSVFNLVSFAAWNTSVRGSENVAPELTLGWAKEVGGESGQNDAAASRPGPAAERPRLAEKRVDGDRSKVAGMSAGAGGEGRWRGERWLGYAVLIWGLGAAIQLSRLVRGEWGFRRRLRQDWSPATERVESLLRECRRAMGVGWNVKVRETAEVRTPAVFGFGCPVVLLPRGMAEEFSDAQLRHVLMHELAHVRRWDHVVHGLMAMLGVVHWFNPVAWLVFRRLRIERELATDARVLKATGESESRAYGGTILRVLETLARVPSGPGVLGILEDRGSVRERIRKIAAYRRPSRWSWGGVMPVVGLALVALTDAPAREKPATEGVTEPKVAAVAGARRERAEDQVPVAVPTTKPGTRMAGRVVDASGLSVAGAQVEIRGAPEENGESSAEGATLDTVTTDGEGRWTSDRIPGEPRGLWFSVRHPDHLVTNTRQALSTATEAGAPTAEALVAGRAELKVEPPIEVRGVVEGAEGRPRAGAEVVATWGQAPVNRRSVRTGTAGEFVVRVTEVGLVRLVVLADGLAPGRMAVMAEQRLGPVTIRLAEGRRLRGRVLGPQGQAMAGARVSYRVWLEDPLPVWSTEADAAGGFEWSGAPADECTLRAEEDGFGWADQLVAAGETKEGGVTELRVFPGFMVEGVAKDGRSGARVADVTLRCGWTGSPDEPCTFWQPVQMVRKADGGFRATVSGGQWGNRPVWIQFAASAPGYQPVRSRLYAASEGRGSVVFEFREAKPWEGRVVGGKGQPIGGAQVAVLTGALDTFFSLQSNLVQVPSGGDTMTTTDGEGRFELSPPATVVRFLAVHPELGYAEVTEEALGREGRIVLQPWGRIEGVLRIGEGLGLGEDIELASNPAWPEAQLRFDYPKYRTRTDGRDGTFVLERVPPGDRKLVRVIRGAEQFWQQSHALEVRVEPGRTTRVKWGGGGRAVTGRFVATEEAQPVEWQRSIVSLSTWLPELERGTVEQVQAWGRSKAGREALRGRRSYAVRVEPDGRFRVEDVPPGEYRLTGNLLGSAENAATGLRPLAYRPGRVSVPSARWRWRGTRQALDVGELKVDVAGP